MMSNTNQDAIASMILQELNKHDQLDLQTVLSLPLEERRQILRKQASQMLEYYEQDSEWLENDLGDLN